MMNVAKCAMNWCRNNERDWLSKNNKTKMKRSIKLFEIKYALRILKVMKMKQTYIQCVKWIVDLNWHWTSAKSKQILVTWRNRNCRIVKQYNERVNNLKFTQMYKSILRTELFQIEILDTRSFICVLYFLACASAHVCKSTWTWWRKNIKNQ